MTLTNEATGVTRETQTNDSGDYGFPEVPVGTYTLSFDLTGFKTNVRKGIHGRIEPGGDVQLDAADRRRPRKWWK